ncbi:GntR family transcriptional regulator [Pigmentiphaga soli]|uniref:GntR family transcriptional regulator n=1 Tax=Pigmentiphaga soli TaxID=1007095 RepID=A0ABP8HF41_9BURK
MKSEAAPDADVPTLVEQAYKAMRQRILDNVWQPGFQALEQELALQLGMSRTPVREAVIRLQNEGLVEVIPRRGVRVLPVSSQDMEEIYAILTALECLAAETVARRKPSSQELKPLRDATTRMEKALARNDLEAWARADEDFHYALVSLSGNRHLLSAVMGYRDRVYRARMFTLRLRPPPVHSTREHLALVQRLADGDAVGAARVNREHRQRASRELVGIFRNFRLQQI